MDPVLALLLGLLLGLFLGAGAVALTLRARSTAAEATTRELRTRLDVQRDEHRAELDRARAEQRARELRDAEENRVLQALSPVQETLRSVQRQVVELESQRNLQHGELAQQLRSAAEADERLRVTTESLASALSNNQTRGVWGETQLRNVVESAGLTNRVDFSVQSAISSESGAGRPDMIVRLPGGKSIAVDAKVPYASYLEASRIPASAGGDAAARRTALLTQHARQVRAHVDALSGRAYWTGLDASPEFTIAFIPSESLLASALESDPTLLDHAFGRRIALASPVNLWAVLKTVAFTWQQNVLTDDAKRLFDLSRELYGRLASLSEHAERLRRSLDSTVTNYNKFASSLESRVLVTARKLDALDETKVLPTPAPVETRPVALTAVEFDAEFDVDSGADTDTDVGRAGDEPGR